MEDITLERLLNNFTEVLQEINSVVERKDIESARKMLEQIEELVKNDTKITLDDREDTNMDHVLHDLLSRINGVIEISEEVQNSEYSEEYTRLTTRLTEIDERIVQINAEISEIQSLAINESEITTIEARLTYLRNELDILTRSVLGNSRDEAINNEIINKLREEIAKLEAELRNRNNGEPVQQEDVENLRNQIKELEDRRQRAIRARQEATSDQEIAIADSDRINLTEQIRDIQARIDEIINRDRRLSEIDSEIENNNSEIDRLSDELNNFSNLGNVNQERIDEINRILESRRKLFQTLSEDLQNADRESDVWANAFAQRRNISNEIAELEAELKELTQPKVNPSNEVNQERIDEINRILESRRKLFQTLSEDLQNADRESDVWANAFAQRRNISDEISELEAELKELTQPKANPSNEVNQEPKVLLRFSDDLLFNKTIQEYFEEKTGIKFDPNLHEIQFHGADDYGDNVATEIKIIQKVKQINNETKRKELEDRIKELRDRNERLKKEKEELNSSKENNNNSKVEIDSRTEAEIIAEIEAKRKLLQELEAKNGQSITSTEEYKKIISEIASLEVLIRSKRSIQTVLTDEQKARIEVLIKERKTLIEEKEKITVKLKEIIPGKKVTDRLDLGEEAARIGDKIFKTAEIRKELSERNVTREEFLEFYTQGRNGAQNVIEELNKQFTELQEEVAKLTSDPESEESLVFQAADAEVSGKDDKAIELYEKIRKRFVESGKYKGDLKHVGFFDKEITSIDDARKFNKDFLEKYLKYVEKRVQEIKSQMDEQKENIEIFEREIQIIKDEQKAIQDAQKDMSTFREDTEKEKALRAKQIRATIFGDEELESEWNERVKRFYSHRKQSEEKARYRDSEGNWKEVEFETIENYPEYGEDSFFLNLSEYKRYLENVSIYKNSGNDIHSILERIDPDELNKYQQMEAEKEGSGEAWLRSLMGQQAEYVASFHGFTNEHGVKYSTLKTAGSTLKAMKPVKGDLPATTKVGNAISNVFRFFGIRKPEFTRIDENGNRVSNIKGGLLTLATDALVIGGATAVTIAGGPLALAGTYGVAYAAKGAVTAGNVIASRRELRKHGDEIRSNLPTLGHPSKDDREVARKHYYRTVEGKSRFGAWLKAKNDKNFSIFRKRARETEEAIAKKRIEESDATIDMRRAEAISKIKHNLELANKNQETRQSNTRTVVRDKNTYNDIVRDPDSLDKENAIAQSARNAVLESYGKDGKDVNPNSKEERKEKYVKESEPLGKTEKLQDSKMDGDSVAATAITIEEKYTARQQKQDRTNRVLTAILTIAGRIGFDAITTHFMKQTTQTTKDPDQVTPDQTTPDQVIPGGTKTVPVRKTVETESIDLDTPISQLKYSDDAKLDIFTKDVAVSSPKGNANIDAFAIGGVFKGKQEEMSVAEDILNFSKTHVQNLSNPDISQLTLRQIGEYLTKGTPQNVARYQSYLTAKGLPLDTKFEDIVVQMVKDGEIYGQAGMTGWRALSPDNIVKESVEKIVGFTKEKLPDVIIPEKTIPGTTIPGATHTVNTYEFDPLLIFDSTLRGAMPGVGVGVGEGLHEAAKQTKRENPGNFEQNNPDLPASKRYKLATALIQRAQEESRNKEQGEIQQNDDEKVNTSNEDERE